MAMRALRSKLSERILTRVMDGARISQHPAKIAPLGKDLAIDSTMAINKNLKFQTSTSKAQPSVLASGKRNFCSGQNIPKMKPACFWISRKRAFASGPLQKNRISDEHPGLISLTKKFFVMNKEFIGRTWSGLDKRERDAMMDIGTSAVLSAFCCGAAVTLRSLRYKVADKDKQIEEEVKRLLRGI